MDILPKRNWRILFYEGEKDKRNITACISISATDLEMAEEIARIKSEFQLLNDKSIEICEVHQHFTAEINKKCIHFLT